MEEIEDSVIKFTQGDKVVIYTNSTREVLFNTRNEVEIICKIPNDWALTRVFQFMDSLTKASDLMV